MESEGLRERLEAELGEIAWLELRQHYATGSVVRIDPGLDLLDVAVAMANDDSSQVASWLGDGLVAGMDESLARSWFEDQVTVQAVVVSPWVLVQLPPPTTDANPC